MIASALKIYIEQALDAPQPERRAHARRKMGYSEAIALDPRLLREILEAQ